LLGDFGSNAFSSYRLWYHLLATNERLAFFNSIIASCDWTKRFAEKGSNFRAGPQSEVLMMLFACQGFLEEQPANQNPNSEYDGSGQIWKEIWKVFKQSISSRLPWIYTERIRQSSTKRGTDDGANGIHQRHDREGTRLQFFPGAKLSHHSAKQTNVSVAETFKGTRSQCHG
jgi:hypothetical protein